jgi:hypothetical protein
MLGFGVRVLGYSSFLAACRRALLGEESCGRSFLIPCGRASINDQSKYTTGVNGLLTFVFWHERCHPAFRMFRFA